MSVTTGADPAAGAQFTTTVPASHRWRLYGVKATLVTDATVANRGPYLIVDDGSTEVMRIPTSQVFAAGTTNVITWENTGFNTAVSASAVVISAPFPIILNAGYRLTSAAQNFQAGDNWGAPVFWYQDYTV